MANEDGEEEAVLTCGVRMVTAPDGAEIPVPSGGVGARNDLPPPQDAGQIE